VPSARVGATLLVVGRRRVLTPSSRRDNRFIGWTDTPLTDDGVLEARVAGQMLKRSGIRFDEVHTSLLRRSIRTANLVLMELHQEYLPVYKHWRLNERSYGDLVGQHKKEAVKKFGKDQVKAWRRSFDIPPPVMDPHHPYHPARDPRYGPVGHLDRRRRFRKARSQPALIPSCCSLFVLFSRCWAKFP
jgi:bisphosphoglycerate-dependent phosphoglycerate mutase family 1